MGFFKSLFKGADRASPEIKGESPQEAFRLEIAYFIKEGESEPAKLNNKAKEKLTEKGLGDLFLSLSDEQRERIVQEELQNKQESQAEAGVMERGDSATPEARGPLSQHFQGQIDDYKRVLKDLGYAEIKSEDILKLVREELGEAEWSEIRQVYVQNEDRAKVREKLKPVIDKASKDLADLTEDECKQITEQITEQAEEIIYQSLTSEALWQTMKLDKSKIWNIAKQWGKKWGLRAALSMGIGVGVSTVLGATVLTGGGVLLPLVSAIGTGGILSGLNVFENSKWGRWIAGKTKGGQRQKKPDEFQKKFEEIVKSDKILHSEKLSSVLGNQISIMTSRKARERLNKYDAAQTRGQSYEGALKGIEPILFGQALTYVKSQEEYTDLSINEKEKIAFLIARLLSEEERNKSAVQKSKDELQRKEPRIYQILEKFNGLRAGSLTAKEEETGRQIGLTAGTIALGAGTSAAYSFLRTTEHWGPFKAISAILGAAGLGGAGLVWAKTAEAKKEYAVMQEIDNLLESAEEKIKDVDFPDPLPESLIEDKNLAQARLEEGILARNPALTARAENFIRRVEELEYKYSQGLEEILGEINKDTKAIEIRKADDIKRLQKAAKTRKALYVAGFGALGAMLGLAGAAGSEEMAERGGLGQIVKQAAGKGVKSTNSGGLNAVEAPKEHDIQVKANVKTSHEGLAMTIRRGQNVESVASRLYQDSGFARNSNQAHIEVARQLVFQYLEQHKNDQKYKAIYDDLVQYAKQQKLDLKTHQGITQTMHHVKIKDFNEIYQNKVPDLVHPGEKLTVDKNGWITYEKHGHIKVAPQAKHEDEEMKIKPSRPATEEVLKERELLLKHKAEIARQVVGLAPMGKSTIEMESSRLAGEVEDLSIKPSPLRDTVEIPHPKLPEPEIDSAHPPVFTKLATDFTEQETKIPTKTGAAAPQAVDEIPGERIHFGSQGDLEKRAQIIQGLTKDDWHSRLMPSGMKAENIAAGVKEFAKTYEEFKNLGSPNRMAELFYQYVESKGIDQTELNNLHQRIQEFAYLADQDSVATVGADWRPIGLEVLRQGKPMDIVVNIRKVAGGYQLDWNGDDQPEKLGELQEQIRGLKGIWSEFDDLLKSDRSLAKADTIFGQDKIERLLFGENRNKSAIAESQSAANIRNEQSLDTKPLHETTVDQPNVEQGAQVNEQLLGLWKQDNELKGQDATELFNDQLNQKIPDTIPDKFIPCKAILIGDGGEKRYDDATVLLRSYNDTQYEVRIKVGDPDWDNMRAEENADSIFDKNFVQIDTEKNKIVIDRYGE